MSCKCQGCGNQYRIDVNVPNDVWERIKPAGKSEGAGLLCGSCIMARLESLGEYGSYELVKSGGPISRQPQNAQVNTYEEMDDRIVEILQHMSSPICRYAATRIEVLQEQLAVLKTGRAATEQPGNPELPRETIEWLRNFVSNDIIFSPQVHAHLVNLLSFVEQQARVP